MSKQDKNGWRNGRKIEVNENETIEAVNSVTGQVESQQNKILIDIELNQEVISFLCHTNTIVKIENINEIKKYFVFIFANVGTSTNIFGMDLFKIFGLDVIQVSNKIKLHDNELSDHYSKYNKLFE